VLAVIALALFAYVAFAAAIGRILGGADDRREEWELQHVAPPQPDRAQDLVLEPEWDLQSVSACAVTA
jgi:hypothetical protein